MKIYFAGSIKWGRDDAKIYRQIIDILKSLGHNILSEHIGLKNVLEYEDSIGQSDEDIYIQDINWIKQCDMVIAEVTNPSLWVGYELAFAEKLNKKVIVLFRTSSWKKLSSMIKWNKYFDIFEYENIEELEKTFSNL